MSPRVSASTSYTDNLFLENTDSAQSDVISQINPGLRLRTESRRAALSLDYRMQNLFYGDHDDANDMRHQLSTILGTELLRDRFFVDANASFTQRPVSATGSQDPENITPSTGLTDVANYTVTPYWRQKFGATTSALMRYSIGEVHYLENTVSGNDAQNQTWLFEVTRSPNVQRLSSTFYYRGTDVHYDKTETQADSRFQTTGLDVRYALTHVTTLTVGTGYEANTYAKVTASNDTEGLFWKAGLGWKPSRRTAVEFTLGERYYGIAPTLSLTHETRRAILQLSYKEDFTTSSLLQAGTPTFDTEGNPIFDTANPTISTEVFLNKTLSVSLTQQARKTTLTLSTYYTDRESEISGSTERRIGAKANGVWRLNQRTIFNVGLDQQRINVGDAEKEYNNGNAHAALTRKLQRNVDGAITYSRLDRGTRAEEPGYVRNLVKAELTLIY